MTYLTDLDMTSGDQTVQSVEIIGEKDLLFKQFHAIAKMQR